MNATTKFSLLFVTIFGLSASVLKANCLMESALNTALQTENRTILHKTTKDSEIKRSLTTTFIELIYKDNLLYLESEYTNAIFSLVFKNTESGIETIVPKIYVGEQISVELENATYSIIAESYDCSVFIGHMDCIR